MRLRASILLPLSILAFATVPVACAAFGRDRSATLVIDPVCRNPVMVLENEQWTTDNTIPEAWVGLESVEGHVTFKFAQKAEFVGDDGLRLKYTQRHELDDFLDLTCIVED